MPMPAAEIEQLVKTALPDAEITLVDTAGDNDHYSITVVSNLFAGKNRVQQHKMVMGALGKIWAAGCTLYQLQPK